MAAALATSSCAAIGTAADPGCCSNYYTCGVDWRGRGSGIGGGELGRLFGECGVGAVVAGPAG